MFAMYGGIAKSDGEMTPYPHSVLVKVDESDRRALEQDGRFFYPAHLGPSAWVGLDLRAADVDWDEVGELVDASYRMVASKKLVAVLDATGDVPSRRVGEPR